ncbi:hypothetical protein ScPMuIL_011265 [Solemya velum]
MVPGLGVVGTIIPGLGVGGTIVLGRALVWAGLWYMCGEVVTGEQVYRTAVRDLVMKMYGCLVLLLVAVVSCSDLDIDPKGYILYCPCMGRFGNQAEHFLGALAFAKSLNRTLVLPPWVEYHWPKPRSVQVPFDKYFKVDTLLAYHRVMTMEKFMSELAPEIWPPGERTVICYGVRSGGQSGSCNAKDGNPFGPFWDTFDIEFDNSEFYSPLHYEWSSQKDRQDWINRFPPDKYRVLAFTGAPAAFPAAQKNIPLHRYLHWSKEITDAVDKVIEEKIGVRPFVGIHLRLGSDFERACEHLESSPMMFAAAQCVGSRGQYGKTTPDMCYPPDDLIVREVKATVDELDAKAVYIATDSRTVIQELSEAMSQVKFVVGDPDRPHVDLGVLGQADHYIGNCISTFSAFVKRERDSVGKLSSFWAFKPKEGHIEL